MTGKKYFCAALSLLFAASPVSAQWVVSDPTSYTYYVEQLKQSAQQIQQLTKQVETMGGVLTEATAIKNQLQGHYNRAAGLVYRIQGIQRAFEADGGDGIFSNAKKWGNVGRAVGSATGTTAGAIEGIAGEELFKDTRKLLDEVFSDPRNMSPEERYRAADRQYQIRQDGLKNVVARGEQLLGDAKGRIKNIEQLAEMINTTANQKDAQDLTNRVLVEILATLNDLLGITAQAHQADALLRYTGSTDAAMNKRKAILEKPPGDGDLFGDLFSGRSSGRRTVK